MMEKALEKGSDKIQKICDALRKDTLEPAKQEAEKIIQEAKARAEYIIREAESLALKHFDDAKLRIEKERSIFHSSLEQAGKQALGELRQAIEHDLFDNGLQKLVEAGSINSEVIAKLIEAVVKAIEKEGISASLSVIVPHAVPSKEINALLGDAILKKLREGGVVLGQFAGGVQIKLHDKKMTLDITDKTLIELLSSYVRKDFRKLIFQAQ